MAKWKNLYAAHEVRMWVSTLIAGAGVVATVISTNPEIKEKVSSTWRDVKAKVRTKFKKKPKTIKFIVVEPNEEGS